MVHVYGKERVFSSSEPFGSTYKRRQLWRSSEPPSERKGQAVGAGHCGSVDELETDRTFDLPTRGEDICWLPYWLARRLFQHGRSLFRRMVFESDRQFR